MCNQHGIDHIDHLRSYLDSPIINEKKFQYEIDHRSNQHTKHLPVSRSHRSERSLHNDRHDQH